MPSPEHMNSVAGLESAAARWLDDPRAATARGQTRLISLRLPEQMLDLLKAYANREASRYQPLLKGWLDDRIRTESRRLLGVTEPIRHQTLPGESARSPGEPGPWPLFDVAPGQGTVRVRSLATEED